MFTDTDQSEFKPGQVWKYKTRPGEEASTLVILKVQTAPNWGTVVHIGVNGLNIKTPRGSQNTIPHMPFNEAAIKNSVTSKITEKGKLTDFEEGYKIWLEAATAGKGGVFTLSVSEAIAGIEKGLNQ